MPLAQRFADAMGQLLGPEFPSDIGLAVSGGGDSMAMLYLAHNWTRIFGVRLWVVTIDHGLRPESAAEAKMVAQECAVLGWPHATLRWQWDGRGNLQDAARRARLSLIDSWRGAVQHVLFAHTQDDQAETVLMRLARGSGVDGLAGMRASRYVTYPPFGTLGLTDYEGEIPPHAEKSAGFHAVRPCLELSRNDLRHYARVLNGKWVEDPTNEDRGFDRVRIRQLLRLMSDEGITSPVLAGTARRMARARDGLKARLCDAVEQVCEDAPLGQVRINRDGFSALDAETQMRLLTSALCYVAASEYRPRAAASEAMLERVLSGGGGTLHGAEVLVEASHVRVIRELAAVRDKQSRPGAPWDDQWIFAEEKGARGCVIKALGMQGWQQIEPRKEALVPYRAALSTPALWEGDHLIACPALGFGPTQKVKRYVLGQSDTGFEAFCLSH
jgi:tRNA(Ile)-lysidine synthase